MIDAIPIYSVSIADWALYAPLARIKIPVARPSADELRATKSLQARVGDKFVLAHYALAADRATNRAHLTLYWQCAAPSDADYTAFVHLLDASGKVVAQRDAPPRDGKYPTTIWDVGEIVKDEYNLAIPADARGPFSLEIGMYASLTQKRLPIGNSDHVVINLGF
jgi:hypothetical protein